MTQPGVVITGIGCVTPLGFGVEDLWTGLLAGKVAIQEINRFDVSEYRTKHGGLINDFDANQFMSLKIVRQTDRMTHFGLSAMEFLLRDSRLSLDQIEPQRVGIMIGNTIGGMEFGERELFNTWYKGPKYTSPYQAIAWFMAATQGQISIAHGIKGYSKTFVANRLGSAHAIGQAFRIIKNGKADVVFAGGVEAPFSPYAYSMYDAAGILGTGKYQPFHTGNGLLIGEGGVLLSLENKHVAMNRGARIYSEIIGYAINTDSSAGIYGYSKPEHLASCIQSALQNAGIKASDVDLIILDGSGDSNVDKNELEALSQVFGKKAKLPALVPKSAMGDLLGAGTAIQVAAGTLAMFHQTLFPISYDIDTENLVYVPTEKVNRSPKCGIVIGRSFGGGNTCIVMAKGEV